VDAIRWKEEFHDLPESDRSCRHELTGELKARTCPNAFDCRSCGTHGSFVPLGEIAEREIYGLPYAPERLYHRGHTWVEPQDDGTVLVGLDEIAQRLMGEPDRVELPAAGTAVEANGTGWRMFKNGYPARVLAPVDGDVVETGGPDVGYYLRLKPRNSENAFRHLLRGQEVKAWVGRELERLQMAFAPAGAAVSLADGGELMHDVISNAPEASWDAILGQVFLEP
jgi:hypothetical protein